jgi:hypothetical protein
MELDPLNPQLRSEETNTDRRSHTLTTWVAITVALIATFLGGVQSQDDNIVQAMQHKPRPTSWTIGRLSGAQYPGVNAR